MLINITFEKINCLINYAIVIAMLVCFARQTLFLVRAIKNKDSRGIKVTLLFLILMAVTAFLIVYF